MEPWYQRNRLRDFKRNNKHGFKCQAILLGEYYTSWRTVAHSGEKIEENTEGKMAPGRIVVSKEQVFDVIDEWHIRNNHHGQERTSTYCSRKYYNVS